MKTVFEDGDVEACECCAGSVEGVTEPVFSIFVLEAQIHATCLEVFKIGATRDFEIGVLSRRPDFDIVGASGTEPEVACAEFDHSIGEVEGLKNSLGIGCEGFERGIGMIGVANFDKFNFVELMHANEAASAESGGTRFASETWGIGGVLDRQVCERKNFLAMEVGDGDFRSGNEEEGIVLAAVLLISKFGELRGADESFGFDDEWGVYLRVPMLGGMEIEQKIDQNAFEFGSWSGVADEPAPAHASGAIEVEEAKSVCNGYMILGF